MISNAGEGRARDVARQFEQFRTAIGLAWPWANVDLDRPVVIVAVKDESSMRLLLPAYWEERNGIRPASVLFSAPDRHFIVLRSDIRGDDTRTMNPYLTSYWSYTALILGAVYGRGLPLWFRNGMASVLSNTTVRETVVQFGLPIQWHIGALGQSRLRLAELIALDSDSPYYTNANTRPIFDAQAWVVLHYMLFGRPQDDTNLVNRVATLLLEGTPSAAALEAVFGSVAALDQAQRDYSRQRVFRFARVEVEESIAPTTFSARPLTGVEATGMRAAVHLATNRPAEARRLIDEARKIDPGSALSYEAEAWLLAEQGKHDESRAALARAVELNSGNAEVHYRLAVLTWGTDPDAATLTRIEAMLRRATEIEPRHAPAFALLSNALLRGNQPEPAVDMASKAASIRPREAYPRLALARALLGMSRRDAARAQVITARQFARSGEERAEVQQLLEFIDKTPAASSLPASTHPAK